MPTRSTPKPSRQDPPLILIADDDETIRVLLRRVMEQAGYRTAEAVDGESCLEKFVQLQPQIVLLDIRMPKLDGLACCPRLKALPGGDRTPILFVTSVEDRVSMERAFEVGASDFITKPIHVSILKQRVKRLLEAGQIVEELRQQICREQLLRALLLQQTREFSSLDVVLNATVAGVQSFLDVDRVLIYEFNDSNDAVVVAEAAQPGLPSLQQSIASSIWFDNRYEQLHQGDVTSIADLTEESKLPLSMIKFLQQQQVQAILEIPILIEETLWGMLVAHCSIQNRYWQAFEIDTLTQLVSQLALSIRHTIADEHLYKMTQRLHLLSTIDALTQVANRRRFNDYLQQEWLRGAREKTPLSIILCDIDDFKTYNTIYGHQMGNDCLKRVAAALGKAIRRPADLVARYSGEEFAIILPNTPLAGAAYVAEQVRTQVVELGLVYEEAGTRRHLTVSMGVAGDLPKHDGSANTLLTLAEQALAQAKLEGHDRIVVSHGEP